MALIMGTEMKRKITERIENGFYDDVDTRLFTRVHQIVESVYGKLMKKKTGAVKCKLKVQVLDFPTNKNVKQKKLEWSYWLYGCDVNVIDWIVEKL